MPALGKRQGHGIELVASQAAPDLFHHQIALGVDHGGYALRTTSVPGRAYSATPADKVPQDAHDFSKYRPKIHPPNSHPMFLSSLGLVRTGAATPGPLSLPTL